ncbi:AMP-binding protein, partial [Streptomyces atriruber]|uniref:AMP-binding protein n=1 Tax=Streptomyces atriruber TaxID=545121 RepID=UPI0012FE825C
MNTVDAPLWPQEFAERYRAAGWWRGETFGQMLRDRAAAHPDRVAIVDPGSRPARRWTYEELDRRSDRLAAGLLARGIGKGDKVVVQLPNIAEFFETVFALFRIGALPVFALPAHRETEVRYFCEFTEAAAYVIPQQLGGFDYRGLAAKLVDEIPTLRHVFVADGDAGPFEALSDVATDPTGSVPSPP